MGKWVCQDDGMNGWMVWSGRVCLGDRRSAVLAGLYNDGDGLWITGVRAAVTLVAIADGKGDNNRDA